MRQSFGARDGRGKIARARALTSSQYSSFISCSLRPIEEDSRARNSCWAEDFDGARFIHHIQQLQTLRRIRSPGERTRSRDSGRTQAKKIRWKLSHETEADETTLSAKGQVKEPAVEDENLSTNLGDGEKTRIRGKGVAASSKPFFLLTGREGQRVSFNFFNKILIFR